MSLYSSMGASSVRTLAGAHPLPSPPAPPSRKRKDRDDDDPGARANFWNPSSPSSSLQGLPRPPYMRRMLPPTPAETRLFNQLPSPRPAPPSAPAPTPAAKPGGNRLLMAGYLAHEFLSRGTLFGRPYGSPAAAQTARKEELQQKRRQQYEEVARILWEGGAHVPGVINPTQLHGWLQKHQEK